MFCWNLIIFRKYCSFPYVVGLGGGLLTICDRIQQLALFLNPFLSSIHLPPKTYFMNVDPTQCMQRIPPRQLKTHYCFWLLMEGTLIVPCSDYDLSFSTSFFFQLYDLSSFFYFYVQGGHSFLSTLTLEAIRILKFCEWGLWEQKSLQVFPSLRLFVKHNSFQNA